MPDKKKNPLAMYPRDVKIASGILYVGTIMAVGAGCYLMAESIAASRISVMIADKGFKWSKCAADGVLKLADAIQDGMDEIIEKTSNMPSN